jgi:Metal binding domain of Ada
MPQQDNKMSQLGRSFALIGQNGKSYQSPVRGTLGGHRGSKIYGRLDCRAALQAIARGGYVKHRVFFITETAAIGSGYRPCAVCLPEKYAIWKKSQPPRIRAIA